MHGVKKKRKWPLLKDMETDLRPEFLNSYMPEGCRISKEGRGQGWRLSAVGHRAFRALGLHTVEGAAKELISLAWAWAVERGAEDKCPYDELLG